MKIGSMRLFSTVAVIAILFLFNLSVNGCTVHSNSDGYYQKTLVEKSFDTSPGKNFDLEASFGDVIINTSDNPKVIVKVLGSEDTYKKLKIDFENTSEGVKVTVKKKDSWNFFNFWHHSNLKFDVTLPKQYNANISSSGGDIYINDLTGTTDLHTSGGDVKLANVNGPATVKTSGGDITLKNTSGNMILKTSGGDIKSVSFNGDLDASTSGGDIVLSGSDSKIKASTSGGEIKLDYTGVNKGIDLYSSGGDIEANLPADFRADAKLSSSGGSIHCKFKTSDIEEFSSHKLIAKFNDGGEPLIIKTSGGDIDIR